MTDRFSGVRRKAQQGGRAPDGALVTGVVAMTCLATRTRPVDAVANIAKGARFFGIVLLSQAMGKNPFA